MADLVVEDQTGLPNANCYVSVKEFTDFAELNGIAYDDKDEDELAIFIVKATNFIDSFETQMIGKRLNPEQALAFPRIKTKSCSGSMYLYDMRNLKKALFYCVEAQCSGFSLLPISVSKDDIIKKEKIDTLEVQYHEKLLDDVMLGRFPMVERYLSLYLIQNSYSLQVER